MPKEKDLPEETQEVKNEKQARAIFAIMPHINTIWFDAKGEWRFYKTPGTKPIERAEIDQETESVNAL